VRNWESKRKGFVSWEKEIDKDVVVRLWLLWLLERRLFEDGSMLEFRKFSKEVLEVERSESKE
jgi:hypothetical protein